MSHNRWVRIVATPGGEAPLDVRSAWVGLTLPLCDPDRCTIQTVGVVSGDRKPPMTGYMVDDKQAVISSPRKPHGPRGGSSRLPTSSSGATG